MSAATLHLIQGQYSFAEEEGFALECGGVLRPVSLRYAMYGEPNAACDNVILVCHALSGSAEVATWWPELFDDPRLFGNDRYCILCSNILGSCYGSTGPSAINPQTGKQYGAAFPLVTIGDMVRAQYELLRFLEIPRVKLVIGGSIGGMQALQWAMDYPDVVEHCVAIGTVPLGAMGLALNHLQRQAIWLDPKWNGGEYSNDDPPAKGIALARAIAMCSYKSAELFEIRFGRKPNRNGEDPWADHQARFDVGGYLDYQGTEVRRALRCQRLPGDHPYDGYLRSCPLLRLGAGRLLAHQGARDAGRHLLGLALSGLPTSARSASSSGRRASIAITTR